MYADEMEMAMIWSILQNQMRTLRIQKFQFQIQCEIVRNMHVFKRHMAKSMQRGGAGIPIPSTQ
ncbi:hypothetical protein Scep_014596 [Stephania cephalantha]|uniref:Uncharacterized protein n=1 Tax=Stephania cephalantha TaxID=152367 RepID=A0AAP0J2A6_9MAGN